MDFFVIAVFVSSGFFSVEFFIGFLFSYHFDDFFVDFLTKLLLFDFFPLGSPGDASPLKGGQGFVATAGPTNSSSGM